MTNDEGMTKPECPILVAASRGSARVSRVGFGVAPKQAFFADHLRFENNGEVRDREDAFARILNACATQTVNCHSSACSLSLNHAHR